MSKVKTVFETLNEINVNGKTEVKDTGKVKLTYLSWAWAWAEAKKAYPNLDVVVHENPQGLPYFASDEGIMVKVTITIETIPHTVYLPVMDGANNAMKTTPYTITMKYGDKEVKAATMMDINKTIQRATVKALGLHGLGLYIYAGEDLPENEQEEKPKKDSPMKKTSKPVAKAEKPAEKEEPSKEKASDEKKPARRGNFRRSGGL